MCRPGWGQGKGQAANVPPPHLRSLGQLLSEPFGRGGRGCAAARRAHFDAVGIAICLQAGAALRKGLGGLGGWSHPPLVLLLLPLHL